MGTSYGNLQRALVQLLLSALAILPSGRLGCFTLRSSLEVRSGIERPRVGGKGGGKRERERGKGGKGASPKVQDVWKKKL